MEVKIIKTGYLEENCYILSINNKCLVIDPGDDFLKIQESLKSKELVGILVTHYHPDHIGALKELLSYYKTKVYDCFNLKEEETSVGDFKFFPIFTPGHKSDAVTYYFKKEKIMFTGDFIFKCDIGRCDLPTGSMEEMEKSIEKIKQYNDDIKIYPGHGESTTLGFEKLNNIYFK